MGKWFGVYHGSNEVLFWGAEDATVSLSAEERALGVRMVNAWTEFAHGRTPWQAYGNDEYYRLLNAEGDGEGYGWHARECNELQEFRFIWNPVMTVNEFFVPESFMV